MLIPDEVDDDGADKPVDSSQLVPGSMEAKIAFKKLWDDAHSPEAVAKARAMTSVPGHEKAVGLYDGKPLIPGPGPGQGDFNLLVDKLVMVNGYDPEVAAKIAGAIKHRLYGGR